MSLIIYTRIVGGLDGEAIGGVVAGLIIIAIATVVVVVVSVLLIMKRKGM